MAEHVDVAIIGAGPAGLATSYELTRAGVDHVVLERGEIGQSWRGRWDSFCLVTPNWTVQLPGGAYAGDDPDGFMPRDEIVDHFVRYAADFAAPIRERTEVLSLRPTVDGDFDLRTSGGPIRAGRVVVASGAYQRPYRPPAAASLPEGTHAIDVEGYQNPAGLPPGGVLIVGSGQSGCQIAEELVDAGREVFLACGRAPWALRRIGGHDLVWWGIETGFVEQRVEDLPDPRARLTANILASGRDRGHDLHLRILRSRGVTLLGHFIGADGGRALFANDLAESVAWGDQAYGQFKGLIKRLVAERGVPMPDLPDPEPFDGAAPEALDLARVGTVLFTGGFRPDYQRWVQVPGAFDDLGFPIHAEGQSHAAPGLFFVGVHFLRKRKSAVLFGMGEDAAIIARQIAHA